MFSSVSINESRVLFRVSIKDKPNFIYCEDHDDWFPLHYLVVDCFFCSGAEFGQVSGLAVKVSLLFAIAGF